MYKSFKFFSPLAERNSYFNWVWGYKKTFLLIPLAVLIDWGLRSFGFYDYEAASLDVGSWEVFFNIFGTVYAVITGLILVEEFQRHSQLGEKLELELNALQDIRDFLDYMDHLCKEGSDQEAQLRAKANIRQSLFMYVVSLLSNDWKRMKNPSVYLDSDTTSELKSLIININSLVIGKKNESDKVGLSAMMSLVADITTLRTQRITLVNKTVPVQLKYLIHLMGAVLVLGVLLLGVNSLFLHMIIVLFSSSIILIIYLLFEDLHNPFQGQWKIRPKGFYQYLLKMLLETKGNEVLFKEKRKDGSSIFNLVTGSIYHVRFCDEFKNENCIREIALKSDWENISIHKKVDL